MELASRFLDCPPEPYRTVALASILTHHTDLHPMLYSDELDGKTTLLINRITVSNPTEVARNVRNSLTTGKLARKHGSRDQRGRLSSGPSTPSSTAS